MRLQMKVGKDHHKETHKGNKRCVSVVYCIMCKYQPHSNGVQIHVYIITDRSSSFS